MLSPAPPRGGAVASVQRQLEAVYGLDRALEAEHYVLRRSALQEHWDAGGPSGLHGDASSQGDGRAEARARARREALLIGQAEDALELALVLDDALADARGPLPLDGFCAIAEGVSHLLYVALAAQRNNGISAFELELQAEIDKFALLVLHGRIPLDRALERLFWGWELDPDVRDPEERDRYTAASRMAHDFCRGVLKQRLQRSGVEALLAELRLVYRLTGQRKREHVMRL